MWQEAMNAGAVRESVEVAARKAAIFFRRVTGKRQWRVAGCKLQATSYKDYG